MDRHGLEGAGVPATVDLDVVVLLELGVQLAVRELAAEARQPGA
jgi:hypothetical protein